MTLGDLMVIDNVCDQSCSDDGTIRAARKEEAGLFPSVCTLGSQAGWGRRLGGLIPRME